MEDTKRESEEAREITRTMLAGKSFGLGPEGIEFKQQGHRHGLMKIEDAMNNLWIITGRESRKPEPFDSIEDLIENGWLLGWKPPGQAGSSWLLS